MKQWITGAALVALALGYTQRADASLFINITDGTGTATCDNSTSITLAACSAGFVTTVGSNNIGFSNLTVGGYTFGGNSGVNTNVPGNNILGLVSDSKLNVTHNSGISDLVVTFAALGFTLPAGPVLSFSSSDTGNWAFAAGGGDHGDFTGWANAANTSATTGTAAVTPTCIGPASGPVFTFACQTQSGDTLFTRGGGAFSLVGQETIHLGVGDIASFTAQETVSAVPEPMTFSLMGAGLLGLGLLRKRLS